MIVAQGSLIQSAVSIASGQPLSATISTEGLSLCGIQLPSAFTGTSLTFLAATQPAGPFLTMYNGGGLITYAAAANEYVAINPQDFYGVFYLQIKSNANEVATRALVCSMKGI